MAGPRATFLLILAIVLVAPGCASPLSSVHDGADSPRDQLAVLDWSGWGAPRVLEIDGEKTTGPRVAKLPAGRHTIRYGGWFGASVLLNPRMGDTYDLVATIDMKAGHVYEPKRERVYGYRAYRDYLWIEDMTTGEVVAGHLPAHHREKLQRSERARAEREVAEHFDGLSVAARCGDGRAQYDLGLYYLAGIEPLGRRDLVHAYAWYSLAASNGYPGADAVKERIEKEMRPEERAEGERVRAGARARECPREPTTPSAGSRPEPER